MKIIFTTIVTFYSIIVFSQSLSNFKYLGDNYSDNETYLSFGITRTSLSNLAAPYSQNHSLSGFSGTIEVRKVNFEKAEKRFYYEHKLLGDMFILTREILFKNPNAIYRSEGSSLSCGILGWASWTWNMNKANKHSLSLGFNLHDYFLASTYKVDSSSTPGNRESFEPQGYWFTAGPKIVYNYNLSKNFIVEASSSYSISYWRAVSLSYATVNNNYPKPHFGQLKLELLTSIGFFTGFDYNWVINRGNLPNNTKRFDAILGFRFML